MEEGVDCFAYCILAFVCCLSLNFVSSRVLLVIFTCLILSLLLQFGVVVAFFVLLLSGSDAIHVLVWC